MLPSFLRLAFVLVLSLTICFGVVQNGWASADSSQLVALHEDLQAIYEKAFALTDQGDFEAAEASGTKDILRPLELHSQNHPGAMLQRRIQLEANSFFHPCHYARLDYHNRRLRYRILRAMGQLASIFVRSMPSS